MSSLLPISPLISVELEPGQELSVGDRDCFIAFGSGIRQYPDQSKKGMPFGVYADYGY